MDVLLITPATNVHHVNLNRPATTQLTKLVVMDVRLTVLAALLAKLANHPAVHQHRQRLRTATAILVRQDIKQVLVVQGTHKKQQHPKYVLAEQKAAELAINVKRNKLSIRIVTYLQNLVLTDANQPTLAENAYLAECVRSDKASTRLTAENIVPAIYQVASVIATTKNHV